MDFNMHVYIYFPFVASNLLLQMKIHSFFLHISETQCHACIFAIYHGGRRYGDQPTYVHTYGCSQKNPGTSDLVWRVQCRISVSQCFCQYEDTFYKARNFKDSRKQFTYYILAEKILNGKLIINSIFSLNVFEFY